MAVEREVLIKVIQEGNAQAGVQGLTSSLGGLGIIAAGAATAGIAIAGAAIVGLGSFLVDSTKEAMAAQEVQAQLGAVLESTGGVAGVTAESANALASSLQNVTRFEDDTVLSAENMLLTFTNIGQKVFPQATEMALDMSTALGIDATQASVVLGKALQNPIEGVSALRRYGVNLTEQQEESIKGFMAVNDIASAQGVILQELQVEFGGSARAAGQTLGGQMDILRNKFGDVKETIGGIFIPILTELASLLSSGLSSPEFQAILQGLANLISDKVVPTLITLVKWFRDEVAPRIRETYQVVAGQMKPAFDSLMSAVQNVASALGISTGKTDALKLALIPLKAGLLAIKVIFTSVSAVIEGFASGINAIGAAIRFVKNKINELIEAAQNLASALPSWLVPGSPTPFELGLRGIAGAMEDVNRGFKGFPPPSAGAMTGGLTAPITVYLTYSPVVSLADRYEAETKLAPFIRAALRGI